MRKFEYKHPRIHSGELRTPVVFYEYEPNKGPEPGEKAKKIIYQTWAKIDRVWLRDIEQAKANNTLSDLTITIRDPLGDYRPSNKHYLEIQAMDYEGSHYNIKSVQPDMQQKDFITIIAGLVK